MAKGGNLGKASLILTTKDETKPGLNKSEGGFKAWASGIKGKVGLALAGIGGAVAGFAGVTGKKLFDNMKDLAEVGKQARALGVASDTFMGLAQSAKEAGVESEQFGTLLQKSQLKVAEGSADTQAALAAIGLTLGDVRGKSPDAMFYAIADGMAGVSDQGTRAVVASKLFEEEGLKLLPVLGKGSASLKEFVAQQRAMGTALSQSDMDGVLSAAAKVTQLERRWEGFINRLTVVSMPFLEVGLDIGEAVVSWLPAFENVKTVGLASLSVIGQAGAYVWDTLKAGAGGFAVSVGLAAVGYGKLADMMGVKEGAAVAKWGSEFGKWGVDQVSGFGQTAKDVERWFEQVANGGGRKVGQKIGEQAGRAMASAFAAEYRLNPAVERGSAEDYSARVRWEQQNQSLQEQQVKLAEKTEKNTAATATAVGKLADKIGTTKPMRTV